MTHTLHRRGSEKELQKDFVILAMAARGVNREGAAPKLARALEIFAAHHPVNYGNVAGNSLTKPLAELVALTRDNTVSHAVFRSVEDVTAVLADLRKEDLGISIVVSGLFEEVRRAYCDNHLKPHTVIRHRHQRRLDDAGTCGEENRGGLPLRRLQLGTVRPRLGPSCSLFGGTLMTTAHQKRLDFRANPAAGKFMIAPGIYDALSAKAAQAAGLPCLAMGGYAISASRLGQPDVGLLSLTEMATALKQICDATDIPIIGDGDTGYGNALNVIRTEQEYEKAGASCIFFEDQVWPKRCGHMDGKQVIAAEEHTQKIRAACDAREDKATLIMARTDTRAVNGIEDAIRRGHLYAEAGAELLFIEALRDRDEVERLAKEFEGTGIYLFANMIEGGKTPIIPASDLKAMGYAGVFWSCASLYLVTKTLVENFTCLNQEGTSDSFADQLLPFAEFNRFIGLDRYKALEKQYGVTHG